MTPLKKRFNRAYLHIGMGKTGSTSIQHCLWANADLLESTHNIHYPTGPVTSSAPGQRGNHSEPLLCTFHPQPEKLGWNIRQGNNTAVKAEESAQRLRSSFEHGFHNSSANELLLSAEGIPTYPPEAVDNLAQWLTQWCDEVRLVACLRHPAEALSSQIQQGLKVGMLLEDMYQKPPFYRYATLLPRLENSFGGSHIHVYDFADAKEDESGLTNRLLREIGHDIQLPDSELERTNSSMSQEATLLLDSLNRQYPHIVSGRHNDKRKTSALTWCQNMPGRKYRAPEYVYKELDGQARRHIEWVTNNYRVNLRSRDRGDEQPEILNIKQIDKRIRRLHRLFSMPGILQRIAFRLLDGQNHSRAS